MKTILKGIVGSHAYGLNNDDSDVDYAGIFAAPTESVLGLYNVTQSIVTKEPDQQLHEIGKFMGLALSSNPTISELLWLDSYEELAWEGEQLLSIRQAFLSQHCRDSYGGYAVQQARRLVNRFENGNKGFDPDLAKRTPKHGRHCARLLVQLRHLLTYQEIRVKLTDSEIRWCRLMGEIADDNVYDFKRLFEKELWRLEDLPSDLPKEPNKEAVSDLLVRIRFANSSRVCV